MGSFSVCSFKSFDEIREDWKRLYNNMSSHTIYNSVEWNELYWEHFKRPIDVLNIIVCYKDNEAVCIAPLKITCNYMGNHTNERIVSFIGYNYIENQDFIFESCFIKEALNFILEYIILNDTQWDILILHGIIQESPINSFILDALKRFDVAFLVDYQGKLPMINLDMYRDGSDVTLIRNINSIDDTVEDMCINKDTSEISIIDDFIKMNTTKWKKDSLYSNFPVDKYKSFYRKISGKLKDSLNVSFFYSEGKVVGYQYAFDINRIRYICYQQTIFSEYKVNVLVGSIKMALRENISSLLYYNNAINEAVNFFSNNIKHNYSYYIGSSKNKLDDFLSRERDNRTQLMDMRLKYFLKNIALNEVKEITWIDKSMKVLVLAPHFDDEILSCGGILSYHCERKDTCEIVYFTNGDASKFSGLKDKELSIVRKDEALKALKHIGDFVVNYFEQPDGFMKASDDLIYRLSRIIIHGKHNRIYFPNPEDDQHDHKITSKILIESLKVIKFDGELFICEFWNPLKSANMWISLEKKHIQRKNQAMKEHITQLKYADYVKLMNVVNTYRGKSIGKESCEFFRRVSLNELINIYSKNWDGSE